MRRPTPYPITVLLVLLFVACSPAPQPLPPLAYNATILAFGDSLTYGTGVSAEQAYPAILEQLTGLEVINAGVPGETSAQGAQRLPQALDEYQPSLLVLCHGGNDMLRHLDEGRMEANLSEMIEAARSRGIPVVLLGVPEPALFRLHSAPVYERLAKRFQLPIEATILPKLEADKSLKSDQVHPNASGYRLVAEALLHLLQQSGAL